MGARLDLLTLYGTSCRLHAQGDVKSQSPGVMPQQPILHMHEMFVHDAADDRQEDEARAVDGDDQAGGGALFVRFDGDGGATREARAREAGA